MGVVINTNVSSLIAQQNLQTSNNQLRLNVQRLSSGYRVNSAADDAAGLARADQLRARSRGIQAALRNANDGVSLLEIADKSAEKITEILTRMNELAVSAAQGTLTTETRGYYNDEWTSLRSEINRITSVTEFGGTTLLNGSAASIDIQIGFKNNANNRLTVTLANLQVASLVGFGAAFTLTRGLSSQAASQNMIDAVETAIATVNGSRALFGANTNRLTSTIANLQVTYTNFQAAESRIRDVDFANETAMFTRNQILVQSGVSVLSQANTLPQAALALIG